MMVMTSNIDVTTLFWIQQHLVNSMLTPFMILLSDLGKAGAVWAVLGAALCLKKEYRYVGITLLTTLLLVGVIGDGALKHLVMRARPCIDFPWLPLAIPTPSPTDYSFPSCHSYASFAAATVLYTCRKRWGIAAFALAAGIAFSRLYLFVHYPSDVLAGALLGVSTAMACVLVVNHVRSVWSRDRKFLFVHTAKKG